MRLSILSKNASHTCLRHRDYVALWLRGRLYVLAFQDLSGTSQRRLGRIDRDVFARSLICCGPRKRTHPDLATDNRQQSHGRVLLPLMVRFVLGQSFSLQQLACMLD